MVANGLYIIIVIFINAVSSLLVINATLNNMKQMGLAMHNYHEVYGHFPAGTHPNEKLKPEKRLSWLAIVLPFIDQSPLFDKINFEEAWDELRVQFGVPMAAGGGGRGGFGRGRGGGGNPANVLARAGALKGTILSFWEAPSAALIGQYYDVKPALEGAIADAEAMLLRAEALSEMLDGEGITMEVPALGN